MTGDELARSLEDGTVTLLDVRSPQEFAGEAGYPCDPVQGHIPGAVNLDVEELAHAQGQEAVGELLRGRGVDPAGEIVVYCHSGSRSAIAAAILSAAGVERVENYEGSWHEWSRRP